MKLKITLFLLALANISLLPAMAHNPRPMARIMQLLNHLTEGPRTITYGLPPGIMLDPDVVIGKHKHLFNFVCSKVMGTVGL